MTAAATTAAAVLLTATAAACGSADAEPAAGTPGASTSTATGAPATATTAAPATSAPSSQQTGSTPSASATTTKQTVEPAKLSVKLRPAISGMTVTMRVTESGSMLAPINERTGKSLSAGAFQNHVMTTAYNWGDGSPGAGANAGQLTCRGANKRLSGQGTSALREPHTYPRAGSYTFTYTVEYCGARGVQKVAKSTKLTIG